MQGLSLLIMLYGILFIMMFSYSLLKAREEERLSCITLARIMYSVIYGLVPFLVHLYVNNNGTNERYLKAFDYSSSGMKLFYMMVIFSIVGFIGLNCGYNVRFVFGNSRINRIRTDEKGPSTNNYTDKTLFISAFIMLAAGMVSLWLWTRAFGGISGILEYASELRSGVDVGIENRYTIFKRFCPLLLFSNIIFWALALKNRSIVSLLLSLFATIFSLAYLMANDGRAPLAMHFVALFWTYLSFRKRKSDVERKPNYILIAIIAVIAIFVMHNYDSIYSSISEGSDLELSFDILSSVREEFSWTVRNIQAVHLAMEDTNFMFRLPIEIISGICGILPSSLRPDWAVKLGTINTSYWVQGASVTYYGERPTDMITTGIYTMNYLGVFLLPMFYGMIYRKLDEYFLNHDSTFSKILFSVLLYQMIRVFAYSNFDNVCQNLFYIGLGIFIIWVVSKLIPNEEYYEDEIYGFDE